jgi:hypothetical protein
MIFLERGLWTGLEGIKGINYVDMWIEQEEQQVQRPRNNKKQPYPFLPNFVILSTSLYLLHAY